MFQIRNRLQIKDPMMQNIEMFVNQKETKHCLNFFSMVVLIHVLHSYTGFAQLYVTTTECSMYGLQTPCFKTLLRVEVIQKDRRHQNRRRRYRIVSWTPC